MSEKKGQLAAIVGADLVSDDTDLGICCAPAGKKLPMLKPLFTVSPKTSDDVQKIVQWAKETGTPLIPVSSDGPHTSGSLIPTEPGAVIVDLRGMNKVLWIDRRTRLVLIEPGVTWEQLQEELKKEGLRVMMPLLPKKGKSVISSLLDREPCMSPKYQWNMCEPVRSLEIIFGTGERIFSGQGMNRGDTEEKWKDGTVPVLQSGPAQIDYNRIVSAAQGTMGIVTWASLKCEPISEAEISCVVESDCLEQLSGFFHKTVKVRFGDEMFIMNSTALASILAEKSEDIADVKDSLSPWNAFISVQGGSIMAKEKVEFQVADITDFAQEAGLQLSASVAKMPEPVIRRTLLSYSGENDWKRKQKGSFEEIFFLSTMDQIPALLDKAADVAQKHEYPFSEVGIYIQPLQQGVSVHCHLLIPVDRKNEKETALVSAMFEEMSIELYKSGAFFSRPYGMWSDFVYDGSAQNTIVTKKIKKVFDPENILNPGKLCF